MNVRVLGDSLGCLRYSRSYKRFCANVTGARLHKVGHTLTGLLHTDLRSSKTAKRCSQAEEADECHRDIYTHTAVAKADELRVS